jgi:hypothetical protein
MDFRPPPVADRADTSAYGFVALPGLGLFVFALQSSCPMSARRRPQGGHVCELHQSS